MCMHFSVDASRRKASQLIMGDQLKDAILGAGKHVLSVGSGDGSQQVAIQSSGHLNITTTFFDSEDTVLAKYSAARANIARLRRYDINHGDASVFFGVDATKLHTDARISDKKFDVIIITFPHTAAPNFAKDSIADHKRLIKEFMLSAQHVLKSSGDIQLTLKTTAPYDK